MSSIQLSSDLTSKIIAEKNKRPSYFEVVGNPSDAWRCIDRVGNRMRSHHMPVNFKLNDVIKPRSGWHVMHFSVADDPQALAQVSIWSPHGEVAGMDHSYQAEHVLAIDYRTDEPVLYSIVDGANGWVERPRLFSDPLQVFVHINKQSIRDYLYTVNTGLDLANRPMPYGIKQALDFSGVDTADLVLGVNGSNPGRAVPEANLNIHGLPANNHLFIGTWITAYAKCYDSLGNNCSNQVKWYYKGGFSVGNFQKILIDGPGEHVLWAEYEDAQGRIVRQKNVFYGVTT